jgi:hypothetical protein
MRRLKQGRRKVNVATGDGVLGSTLPFLFHGLHEAFQRDCTVEVSCTNCKYKNYFVKLASGSKQGVLLLYCTAWSVNVSDICWVSPRSSVAVVG